MFSNIHLPSLNAALNALSATLLLIGLYFIRRKNIRLHRLSMTGAFVSSVLFLMSYLYYHAHAGATRFQGTGILRRLYFSILISHTVLAAVIAPLALVTLALAYRQRFITHARLARWTWPLWMYVSVTGVVIYWMLYRI